jgi:hypothetical protein
VWCPTNPASYDVTRSISPLTKKKPASNVRLGVLRDAPAGALDRVERRLRAE